MTFEKKEFQTIASGSITFDVDTKTGGKIHKGDLYVLNPIDGSKIGLNIIISAEPMQMSGKPIIDEKTGKPKFKISGSLKGIKPVGYQGNNYQPIKTEFVIEKPLQKNFTKYNTTYQKKEPVVGVEVTDDLLF